MYAPTNPPQALLQISNPSHPGRPTRANGPLILSYIAVMDATGVVIGLVGLIWDCYNRCKNNRATFRDLERDYRSLEALLIEVERDLPHGARFDPIREGCQQIAANIKEMLDRYAVLGTGGGSPYQLLRWSLENIEYLRSGLITQVVMLSASSR
jgi:hypothetical protein